MSVPSISNIALKEWAVAVNILGQGKQIVVLRKGGIHRDDRDFRFVHPEFLLYPTYEHQKGELIKPEFHEDLRETYSETSDAETVEFTRFCKVTDRFELRDEADLDRISDLHIWTDDYAHKRLRWRPKQPLTVALLRVYILHRVQSLPVLAEYSGCKSWVELDQGVPLGGMEPVLGDTEYEGHARAVKDALAGAMQVA